MGRARTIPLPAKGATPGVKAALSVALMAGCLLMAACQSRTSACTDCFANLAMVDQHGRSLSLSSLAGRTVLIDFIYTSCPGPCGTLTSRLARVADGLAPLMGSRLTFVSVTIDPEHDGATQLLAFAKKHGAEMPGWLFLTASPLSVDELLARFGLHREREPDGEMAHMEEVFLVGPDGRELRRYNGELLKPRALMADIRQAAEAPRGRPQSAG